MRAKIEITSYEAVVFEGEFENFAAVDKFWVWWANQAHKGLLPQGGAVISRADVEDAWRAAHPLPFQPLTAAQQEMVERYLVGGEVVKADETHHWNDEFCSCGNDTCADQVTGRRLCPSITVWVDGVGNVAMDQLWRGDGYFQRLAEKRAAGRAK